MSTPTSTPTSPSSIEAPTGAGQVSGLTPSYRETSKLKVRPYLLTGGRTRSEIELALETPLVATEAGTAERRHLTLERLWIVDACQEPIPVVELAARLGLPLQVIRVLVGDLVQEGLMEAQSGPRSTSERPDLALLERVLDGLQNL
jgi:Protein of unknown function (DUF742)